MQEVLKFQSCSNQNANNKSRTGRNFKRIQIDFMTSFLTQEASVNESVNNSGNCPDAQCNKDMISAKPYTCGAHQFDITQPQGICFVYVIRNCAERIQKTGSGYETRDHSGRISVRKLSHIVKCNADKGKRENINIG